MEEHLSEKQAAPCKSDAEYTENWFDQRKLRNHTWRNMLGKKITRLNETILAREKHYMKRKLKEAPQRPQAWILKISGYL